jgi:hypothetical protein
MKTSATRWKTVRGVASDVGRSGVYLKQGVIRMCFKPNIRICDVRDKLRYTGERDDSQACEEQVSLQLTLEPNLGAMLAWARTLVTWNVEKY